MQLPFTKMQGAGNDYIFVVDGARPSFSYPAAARALSPRHHAVGADGLVVLSPAEHADFTMRMYNADGSEGAVCGNALRCAARLWYERGGASLTLRVACRAGVRCVRLHRFGNGAPTEATVDMGYVTVLSPSYAGPGGARYTLLSVGNRHAVCFSPPADLSLPSVGRQFERLSFPSDGAEGDSLGGFNTEFVTPDEGDFVMRVYERGSGETLACGSGAVAVVGAAVRAGLCLPGRETVVRCPGGRLFVRVMPDGRAFLRGDAVRVFDGVAELPREIFRVRGGEGR